MTCRHAGNDMGTQDDVTVGGSSDTDVDVEGCYRCARQRELSIGSRLALQDGSGF